MPSRVSQNQSGTLEMVSEAIGASPLPHLLARPEVLMELHHFVEKADLGHEHEHDGDRDPHIVPRHLVLREVFGDVHDLEAKCE